MMTQNIALRLEQKLQGHIDTNQVSNLHYAILSLVREDGTIGKQMIIGPQGGPNKAKLLTYKDDKFYEVLANVLYYCIQNKNVFRGEEVEKVTEEFFNNAKRSFGVETLEDVVSPIASTINSRDFDEIFHLVAKWPFGNLPNTTTANVYCLQIQNGHFEYGELAQFIRHNISEYIFSRIEIDKMKEAGEGYFIGNEAFKQFRKKCGTNQKKLKEFLANMMLYVFLEKVLGAVKIFTRFEKLDEDVFYSDGVYLLPESSDRKNELVLGSATLNSDLKKVADNIFKKINQLLSNDSAETKFINQQILRDKFTAGQVKYLRGLLRPKKKSVSMINRSFGCFLGYSFDSKSLNVNNEQYVKEARKRIQQDGYELCEYVAQTIIKEKLQNYSFYFYILPFNDAMNDADAVLKDLE